MNSFVWGKKWFCCWVDDLSVITKFPSLRIIFFFFFWSSGSWLKCFLISFCSSCCILVRSWEIFIFGNPKFCFCEINFFKKIWLSCLFININLIGRFFVKSSVILPIRNVFLGISTFSFSHILFIVSVSVASFSSFSP